VVAADVAVSRQRSTSVITSVIHVGSYNCSACL
jgi:hypothetical protein